MAYNLRNSLPQDVVMVIILDGFKKDHRNAWEYGSIAGTSSAYILAVLFSVLSQ